MRIRKWNQLSRFQYQLATFEPRVLERQQVKDQRSYIPISVAYIKYPDKAVKHFLHTH